MTDAERQRLRREIVDDFTRLQREVERLRKLNSELRRRIETRDAEWQVLNSLKDGLATLHTKTQRPGGLNN